MQCYEWEKNETTVHLLVIYIIYLIVTWISKFLLLLILSYFRNYTEISLRSIYYSYNFNGDHYKTKENDNLSWLKGHRLFYGFNIYDAPVIFVFWLNRTTRNNYDWPQTTKNNNYRYVTDFAMNQLRICSLLWSVQGNQAVELLCKSKKNFRINHMSN